MAFLRRFFFTFCPILEASNWLLIHADFFIFLVLIGSICTYSMVSKHKIYLLPGRNEARSKTIFRQLRISTLCTSNGYKVLTASNLTSTQAKEKTKTDVQPWNGR